MDKLAINPLISIIVPIYKVESYLQKCVDSIINQTYENLEIILVNDGSPDNCGAICDEYAKSDNRIKVIHKENGGLSDARNAGLKIATGEWISFVDSDDWLETDAIEQMLNLGIDKDADLIIGGTRKINDNDNSIIWVDAIVKDYEIMNKEQAICDFFVNGCASWARLYKKDIHKNIFFPVGEINEDEAIVLKLLEKCSKIVKTSKIVYNYRLRPESITTTSFHPKKLIWYYHCKANLSFIEKNHPTIIDYAERRYFSSILFFLIMISREKDQYQYSDILFELLVELKTNFKKILKNKHLTKKDKLFAFIIKFFSLKCYSLLEKAFSNVKY
ncbi:MAG: glycosyltransferase family 2 protein [Clostridia bacterium]|nr:glycosyltransferase family 2 protein [Clostridia bacterium]